MAYSPAASPTEPAPPEMGARDVEMAWYRGEFAAASAIIDALSHHLNHIAGPDRYGPVFAAIHRRRRHWVPVIHMQRYFSIAEISVELRLAAAAEKVAAAGDESADVVAGREVASEEDGGEKEEHNVAIAEDGDSSDAAGSGGETLAAQSFQIFRKDEMNAERSARIRITKGFVAKELVKGHMVNVVKGLQLYEDVFTDLEISKLRDCINKLRLAGRKGELSGETFILFNKDMKRNKREIIQLGTPMFQSIQDPETSSKEPIPSPVQAVIDELIRCRILLESCKPNGCIINFFDEGEYSQPYTKPPHLIQPISTLLLSETTMAFGRILVSDHDGNFKGPLILSLKQGSLLFMRGNSAEVARHVMCPSPNKRVSLTFFKVQTPPATAGVMHPANIPLSTRTLTQCQPGLPYSFHCKLPSEVFGQQAMAAVAPKWGFIRATPTVMMVPAPAAAITTVSDKRLAYGGGGTGVFLPWTAESQRRTRYVPPRIRRVPNSFSSPSNIATKQPFEDSE